MRFRCSLGSMKNTHPMVDWKAIKAEFGISLRTIQYWRKLGLPAYKPARRVLFDPAEVRAWIKSHKEAK